MGDLIRDSFTQFYEDIGKSYRLLNENRARIEDRKTQMLKLLKTDIAIPEPPKGAGEYQDLCREMMERARVQLRSWQDMVRRQIECSEFVNRHEKSILALVFADVNAGKSSLGNFIGGWDFRDTPYEDLYILRDCEIEDYSTASSPFKKDEREILAELFRMGKPVILAITKSDDYDTDVVDGKRVRRRIPKSDQIRQAQERLVAEQPKEINNHGNLENTRILSLSVLLARNVAEKQDMVLYKTSNLDQFLAQMGEILSEKAIELKMRRPKTEIGTFIERIIGTDQADRGAIPTIRQLRSELGKKQEDLKCVLTECKNMEPAICAGIEQMFPVSLSKLFRSLRERKLLADRETVGKEVSEDVSRLTAEVCRKALKETLGAASLSMELPGLKVQTDGVSYRVQYVDQIVARQVERGPRGFIEHIWRVIDQDKKYYERINDKEKIATGDNFNKFFDAQVEHLCPEVRQYMSTIIDNMASACINPLTSWTSSWKS